MQSDTFKPTIERKVIIIVFKDVAFAPDVNCSKCTYGMFEFVFGLHRPAGSTVHIFGVTLAQEVEQDVITPTS